MSVQPKIPPITVKSKIDSTVNYVNLIRVVLWRNNFDINLNNKDSRIYDESTSDQQKLIVDSSKKEIDYFTYARKNQKIKKLVLKAAPCLEPEVLLTEMTEISTH